MLHFSPEERAAHYRKAIRHLGKQDETMKRVISAVGPCKLEPAPDHFLVLVRSIISQQISTKAAASIAAKLLATVGKKKLTHTAILDLTEEQMRLAGLSRAKVRYMRDLAERVDARSLRLQALRKMADEDVIEELIQVKGIGRWTAEMFLMFSLGRPDVLPVDDLGFRAAVMRHYELAEIPNKAFLVEFGERWRPYRSIATWYLWRSLALEAK